MAQFSSKPSFQGITWEERTIFTVSSIMILSEFSFNSFQVMSHQNFTVFPNNTIQGGKVTHVGQLFFDQDLVDEMTKLEPYTKNKSPRMFNKNDMIMAFGSKDGSDPVVEYIPLSNKLDDGVFAWINFGIDSTATRSVRAAANCYETGCVPNTKGFPGLGDLAKGIEDAAKGVADLLRDPSKLGDLISSISKGFPGGKDGGFPPKGGKDGGFPPKGGKGGKGGKDGGFGGFGPPGMFPGMSGTELPKGYEAPTNFPMPFPAPIGAASAAPPASAKPS
jgi:hypothetical protein